MKQTGRAKPDETSGLSCSGNQSWDKSTVPDRTARYHRLLPRSSRQGFTDVAAWAEQIVVRKEVPRQETCATVERRARCAALSFVERTT